MKTSILAVAVIGMVFAVSAKAEKYTFTGIESVELLAAADFDNADHILAVKVRECTYSFIRKSDVKLGNRVLPKGSMGYVTFPQKVTEPCKEHINSTKEIPVWDESEIITLRTIKETK